MAGRKKVSGVVAVSQATLDELDPEAHIGWLATYTNPDEERSGAKFLRSWAKHGLDVDDLPEARQPVHVFQSACASVKTARAPGSNGHRIEITANEIDNTATSCAYQIDRKVWDKASQLIDYERGMRVRFDKATSDIVIDELDAFDPALRELEGAIREHFDANATTIPGQKVRNAVRAQILKVGGQNLRRKAGGLYFVPAQWSLSDGNGGTKSVPTKPVLDGLAGVLADLYGDRGDFYSIPLANDEGERAMVRKHFIINANEQARELAEKAIQRVRQGKGQRGVRSDLLANMWNERRKLGGAVQQFQQLVTVEQEDLAANLRELDDALAKLQELADE